MCEMLVAYKLIDDARRMTYEGTGAYNQNAKAKAKITYTAGAGCDPPLSLSRFVQRCCFHCGTFYQCFSSMLHVSHGCGAHDGHFGASIV